MKLLIVESPSKSKTIRSFLGKEYVVKATAGHIKNLPKEYSVHRENNKFNADWIVSKDKKELLSDLRKSITIASEILIATDDDREGERIAEDIVEVFKIKNYKRITFREISKKAVLHAINNSTVVDNNMVQAQMTRRMIDRIFGYPITNAVKQYLKKNNLASDEEIKKVGLGRVTAPSLGFLVKVKERQDEFIETTFNKIRVKYFEDGKQFTLSNDLRFKEDQLEELENALAIIRNHISYPHMIDSFEESVRDRHPYPTLTTVFMQTAACSQFGFTPDYTMKIAQSLYEGIDLKDSRKGLITYIRTDSNDISNETIFSMCEVINKEHGEKYVFQSKRVWKSQNKNAQEGHECIRPVEISEELDPENIKSHLFSSKYKEDAYKLYKLIFERTIATQMSASLYDNTKLSVNIEGFKFFNIANKQLFDGWEKVGRYWYSEDGETKSHEAVEFPESLYQGQELVPLEVEAIQLKEEKPKQYSISRFIKTLEKYSIARPSTIGNIPKKLEERGLITIKKHIMIPEILGIKIYYILEEYAPWLIDPEHNLKFEDDLDLIARGEVKPNHILAEYDDLKNEFLEKIGFVSFEDEEPEEWRINKAKTIAAKKGQTLTDVMIKNKKLLIDYINKNKEELVIIGRCPECKKHKVIEREYLYCCSEFNCEFTLWKSAIAKFFDSLEKHIPEDSITSYVELLLKNKKIYFEDLYSKKKEKKFKAFVVIEKATSNDKTYWNLSLSFPKKEVDEKYKAPSLKHQQKKNTEHENNQLSNNQLKKETSELMKKIKILEEEKRLLKDNSKNDHLTRAFNRATLEADMQQFFNKNTKGISAAFIDGDKFKNVNDTYGHQAGDEVLKYLTNKMFLNIKDKRARCYRYGGEEFLIIFIGETKSEVLNILERIRVDIQNDTAVHDNKQIRVTISIGVSFLQDIDTKEKLIHRADNAVYRAKENGRNRIEIGMNNE